MIKNTAANTSIQEAERVKERGIRRKEKVETESKRESPGVRIKGTLAEIELLSTDRKEEQWHIGEKYVHI